MEQGRPRVPGSVMFSQGRPILLAALGVSFDEEAVPVALDPAVEAGTPLTVASITELEPLALSVIVGYDALQVLIPEVSGSVRRRARLAVGLVASWELRPE